jgi:23S rRNA pseudouridine1911/1915/1917 synthase
MDKIVIEIQKQFDTFTIKEFLKEYNVGRGKIEELRVNKSCYLNGEQVSLETVMKTKDKLEIVVNENVDVKPSKETIDVVYEDDYLLIVNKPVGLIVHSDGNDKETMCSRVARYYLDHNINRNVRYAHRLDEETSGILIFAKDFLTLAKLNELIENHTLTRDYLALVSNRFKSNTSLGTINKNIAKDRHVNNKFRVGNGDNSKPAITKYKVLESKGLVSLVYLHLLTGRTHQIRVHMASINHPLLGDTLYGGNKDILKRVGLHSYHVEFRHPITNEFISLNCPLPQDMNKIISLNKDLKVNFKND